MRIVSGMLLCLLLVGAVPALAVPEVTGQSAVSAVTVYPDRALVTRRAEVQLPAGEAVVVLPGMPAGLDVSTAQVRATGLAGLALASLEFKRTPVSAVPDEKIEALREKIRQLENQQKAVEDRISNCNREYEMYAKIMDFQTVALREGLQTRPLTAAEIESSTTLLRQKLDSNRTEMAGLNAEIYTIKQQLNTTRRELQQLAHPQAQMTLSARVPVQASRAGKAVLEVTYLMGGASWGATYDIRALTEARKIVLKYDAIVTQHTGEDWNEAELTLSTAAPALGAAVEDPSPLSLRRFVPLPPMAMPAGGYSRMAAPSPVAASTAEMRRDEYANNNVFSIEDADAPAEPVAQVMTAAVGTGTAVTYRVAGKVNVPSDNQEHRFAIGESQLDATWSYRAVPRNREYGYLRSELQYNGQMTFLPGTAAIFQDDNFVGKTQMSAVTPGDTLSLQFGPDRRVSVAREDVRQQREDKFGSRQAITYSSTLVVRNNRTQAVRVTLTDRVPVSSDEDIKVEIDDDNLQPDVRQVNGLVVWKLELAPGETKKIPFTYMVSWPGEVTIQGLE